LVKLLSLFSRYHFIHLYIQFPIVFRSRKKIFFWFTILNIFVCLTRKEKTRWMSQSLYERKRISRRWERKKIYKLQTMNDWMNVQSVRFCQGWWHKEYILWLCKIKVSIFSYFLNFLQHTRVKLNAQLNKFTAHTVVNIYTLISIPHCNAACIHVKLIIIIIKFPHL